MRTRITFMHPPGGQFDPTQLRLENDTLHVESLRAAREDRLTVGLDELPQELWRALKQCHELHLRWVSPKSYPSIAPFVSRASPGLHVFFTPQRNRSADRLCPLLLKVFGANTKCASPEETFTALSDISERFTSTAALQFYDLVPALNDLITYIQLKICSPQDEECLDKASSLDAVDYLDIDYDAISQSLVLSVFRHEPPRPGTWTAKFQKPGDSAKTEIGVLASEKATEPEELSLGGFLTTIGESTQLKPTRFSFPSRHHRSPQDSGTTYLTAFMLPTGLHPTLRLTFPSTSMRPPLPTCALHTYLILPSSLFPDKYQLSSPLFLAFMNLRGLRAISGETDLEAPNWVVKKWGSALLMELAPPSSSSAKASRSVEGTPWHASIPLHLRYLPPSHKGTTPISVPWPLVFWACHTDEGIKMGTNPFDRVHLGYEGLFGPRTMFYHLRPEPLPRMELGIRAAEGLVESVQVPVFEAEWDAGVGWGTLGLVLLGFSWVVGKLVGTTVFWGSTNEGRGGRRKRD